MELLEDVHDWIDALVDRMLTAHTYNEETAKKVYESIKNIYFPLLN